MKEQQVSFFSKTYNKALTAFRKQFKDVVYMTAIHINDAGKVYAGEWYDSRGIFNFNGGYAPDLHKTIKFI